MIRGTSLPSAAPAEFRPLTWALHAINSGNGEAPAWNVIASLGPNLTLPMQNWSFSSVQHPLLPDQPSSCYVWFGESHSRVQRVQTIPDDETVAVAAICFGQRSVDGTLSEKHCWIAGKGCLQWLELACGWQCYSPAHTDVSETQKGLIGNLIFLPQAPPSQIFLQNPTLERSGVSNVVSTHFLEHTSL